MRMTNISKIRSTKRKSDYLWHFRSGIIEAYKDYTPSGTYEGECTKWECSLKTYGMTSYLEKHLIDTPNVDIPPRFV